MKFYQLTQSPFNDERNRRRVREGDDIAWQIACFKLGKRSLEMMCIAFMANGTAGRESYYPEPETRLFRTGNFIQKEVVDRYFYLGDKTIWYSSAAKSICFVEIVKVENAKSNNFANCQAMGLTFDSYTKFHGLNQKEQSSLACALFTSHWLRRQNTGDFQQWLAENEHQAIAELGLVVRNTVDGYVGQLPPVILQRVKAYAPKQTPSSETQGQLAA